MYNSLISVSELKEHLPARDWVVIDCRYNLLDRTAGYRSYLEAHIPAAIYADLHDDLSGPPITDHGRHPLPAAVTLEQTFSAMGIGNNSQVVVYDDASGSVAARLWWMLQYLGHAAVALLDGGWQAWLAAGNDVAGEEVRNHPQPFRGNVRRSLLVTLANVPTQELLIDARDPARYRGENEPLDPVAGHIPGALNHFWKNNLGDDGKFIDPPQLKQRLLQLYNGHRPEAAVFYCGSGVTACHDILAAVYAGLPFPGLYVGSWSEWCSDPARPVATTEE